MANRVLQRLLTLVRALGFTLAVMVFAGWLAGRVLTDSIPTIQWVHWIPTIVALTCSLVAALLCIGSKWRRLRIVLWCIVAAEATVFLVQDFRVVGGASSSAVMGSGVVRVAHFNASWPGRSSVSMGRSMAAALHSALGEAQPDVIFLSECGGLLSNDAVEGYTPPDSRALRVGRFGIVTRIPVIEARPLFDDGLSTAAFVRFAAWKECPAWTAVMIDAPGHPSQPRVHVLDSIRARLETLGCPVADVVVGDFNAVRGGASLSRFAPLMRHAFDEAGTGFGATYPRRFPLLHIDHILLGARVAALRYEVVDPGLGQHRMQTAILKISP